MEGKRVKPLTLFFFASQVSVMSQPLPMDTGK